MYIKDRIIAELIKNPNGLKATQLASLLGVTKHKINKCLYANNRLYFFDCEVVMQKSLSQKSESRGYASGSILYSDIKNIDNCFIFAYTATSFVIKYMLLVKCTAYSTSAFVICGSCSQVGCL